MKDGDFIELEHFYPHPPAAVWRALTTPEMQARWWVAGDIKPVVGHRFELDMGTYGKQACEVIEVVPERLIRYTFAIGTLDTVISWRLRPENGGTRLILRHEEFDLGTPLGRQAREGMGRGWPDVLDRMSRFLASATEKAD